MSQRLPAWPPATLTAGQRALHDELAGGERARSLRGVVTNDHGELAGPFRALLLSPAIGQCLQNLGTAIRTQTQLSDRLRELCALTVAVRLDSEFQWAAHRRLGRRHGVRDAELAQLEASGRLSLQDPAEEAAVALTVALLTGAPIGDDDYDTWRAVLGERSMFEVSTLTGYYTMLALQMRVFAVDAEG